MTGIRKLGRDFVAADLTAVDELLGQLSDEDVMVRIGLESRRREIHGALTELEAEPEAGATAALFFGGRPVVGTSGIESEFAGTAVAKFQDLVAKLLVEAEAGALPQFGPVPNKAAAKLHITDVLRGSFGFMLEEIQPQGQMVDTALKAAVERASRLMDSFGEADEERFQSTLETIDQRVLSTAREFFGLLRQDGATLRLVAGEFDRSFGPDDVRRAADRANVTDVNETKETLLGQLAGVLPDGHMFEFRAEGPRGTLRGKVDRAIPASEIALLSKQWVDQPAEALVRVKQVLRGGSVVRENFTLLRLGGPGESASDTANRT